LVSESLVTHPTGRVTNKAEDTTDLSSGDYKIQSEVLSDLTVHVYGSIAAVAATKYDERELQGAGLEQ
jgi:hypothetical protein